MGVYKLSAAGGITTPRTNYSSFLAGNAAFVPGAYESIASTTVGSGGVSTITFSSIPDTYKHLQIRYTARVTGSTTAIFIANFTASSELSLTSSRVANWEIFLTFFSKSLAGKAREDFDCVKITIWAMPFNSSKICSISLSPMKARIKIKFSN